MLHCVENAANDLVCFVDQAVPLETLGNDPVIVWPDRSAVIGEGIIAGVLLRERANSPAAPHIILEQATSSPRCFLRVGDPTPQTLSGIRGNRGNLVLLRIKTKSIASLALQPEHLVKTLLKELRLLNQLAGALFFTQRPKNLCQA